MLTCKYGEVRDYEDRTYEELLELRSKVMEDIRVFENETDPEENWMKKPGADYEYRLNLSFLSDLVSLISRVFHKEHMEFLRAVNSGSAILYNDESTISQMKRYSRFKKESATPDDSGFIEFTVNDRGKVEAFIDGERAGTVSDIGMTSEYEFDDYLDGVDAYLLLEAECQNRNSTGAGSWRKTVWNIYSDGYYQIRTIYNLSWSELEQASIEDEEAGRESAVSGVLEEEQFDKLLKALDKQIWRNAIIRINSREEKAWQLTMYDNAGKIVKTSGEPNSVKGNRNMEAIIACLPSDT